MEPATHGFGLFGADFGYPGGGLCLSVFLAVERGGRLLVGRMAGDQEGTWTEEWAPNLAFYEGARRESLFEGWRFPATYLRVGEAPEAAAERVWSDQLGFPSTPELGSPTVVSSAQPSRRSPEHQHWDVVFVHRVQGEAVGDAPAHWAELGYRAPSELSADEAVMMHGDLVDELSP